VPRFAFLKPPRPFSLDNNFTLHLVLGLLHYFSTALHADTGIDPIEAAAPKLPSSAILISPPARLECSVSHLPHYSPRRNLPHERSCRAAYMRITTVFTDLQSSAHPIATCRPSVSDSQRMDKPRSAWTPCPESQSPTHHETLAEWATDLGQTKLLEIPIFAI
jgi:hypothetical protein